MAAITTFIAIAGVAAAIGGTVSQKMAAAKQASAAKKQGKDVAAAATAKRPGVVTGAAVALRRNDKDARRGRGSRVARRREASLGLSGPSASSVGGL